MNTVRTRDYTNDAICLACLYFLLFPWYPVALVRNIRLYAEANRAERESGQQLSGVGCLVSLLVAAGLYSILLAIGLSYLAAGGRF